MGWSFRRSRSLGPLRINLSSSGVSASIGVKGARLLFNRRGTYVSFSGGGFSYRKRLQDAPSPDGMFALPAEVDGRIETADVSALEESSSDELVSELHRRSRMDPWFGAYVFVACAIAMALLPHPALLIPWFFVAVLLGFPVYQWDRERRTTRIFYDIDNPDVVRRVQLAANLGAALTRTQRLWHIFSSSYTSDYKRNAGASNLVRRTLVACSPRLPRFIESNVDVWSIPAGPQRLVFFPDRLLIEQRGRFASVRYADVEALAGDTSFVETPPVPRDAECVGTTWTYVNRSGGPDRRFNNNHRLLIMRYGEWVLRTRSGINIVFQTSLVETPEHATRALDALGDDDRAWLMDQQEAVAQRNARRHSPEAAAPTEPDRTPESPPENVRSASAPTTAAPDDRMLVIAAAGLLKYIALADRRYSDEERAHLVSALFRLFPASSSIIESLVPLMGDVRLDDEEAVATSRFLAASDSTLHERVMHECGEMALADGKMTPKERERFARIRRIERQIA